MRDVYRVISMYHNHTRTWRDVWYRYAMGCAAPGAQQLIDCIALHCTWLARLASAALV